MLAQALEQRNLPGMDLHAHIPLQLYECFTNVLVLGLAARSLVLG